MHMGGKREASGSKRLSVASQGLGGGAVLQDLRLGHGTAWASLPKAPHFCVWETETLLLLLLFKSVFIFLFFVCGVCVCVCMFPGM